MYPTKEQTVLLNKHFGCTRFIYNHFLNFKQTEYQTNKKTYSRFDIQKQLTLLKQKEEYIWLKEVNSQSLQCTIQNLDSAYLKFFKQLSKFPKYKSKKNTGSFKIPFQLTNNIYPNIIIGDNKIKFPKFKSGIKIKKHREIEGDIIFITISKTPTNKIFVSVTCNQEISSLKKNSNSTGLDLGINHFAIDNNGNKYENPRFLKTKLKKIKYLQRQFSKKQKHSSNKEKSRQKLALQYEKITNKRNDFFHKLSSKIINENQIICLEDLSVEKMLKNHYLAQSIQDVSWTNFTTMLEYKANWYDREIVKINKYFPSSKICNCCSHIKQNLTLSDRNWTCEKCGHTHDRDVNAAKNIHDIGLKYKKFGLGINSNYKQKPQEALSKDKSMNAEAMSFTA